MRQRPASILSCALLIGIVAAYRPAWTGMTAHIWLGVVLLLPMLLHAMGALRPGREPRRLAGAVPPQAIGGRVANALVANALFVTAIAVTLSGFMLWPTASAAGSVAGAHVAQLALWRSLHLWSASATAVLVALHALAHWRVLLGRVERPSRQKLRTLYPHVDSDLVVAVRTGAPAEPLGVKALPPSRVGVRRARAAAERRAAIHGLSVVGLAFVVCLAILSAVALGGSHAAAQPAAHLTLAPTSGSGPASVHAGARHTASAKAGGRVDSASGRRVTFNRSIGSLEPIVPAKSTPVPRTSATVVAVSTTARPATKHASAAVLAVSVSTTTRKRTSAKRGASLGTITIETFGYDYGPAPSGCTYVADVRNIDAGNFPASVTGLMASVRDRVMATPAAQKWHQVMKSKWLPNLKAGDKVAIGCARGHHRSVSLAVVFGADVRAKGYTVKFVHRDIKRTW